jgi:hypothetical protein
MVGEWIWWKYYVHIYVNGEIRHIETIPGIGESKIKENDNGGGEFNYDVLKKFCKCHNVPSV